MIQALKSTVFLALSAALVGGAFLGGAALIATGSSSEVAAATLAVPLNPASLTAKAAILYDLKTGDILFQKDAQEPLPLASLTKLMTLQTALSDQSLNQEVAITAADLTPEGDWGLAVGDRLSLRDLVALAVVASCNDCAEAVASTLGTSSVNELNATAQDLNLTRSTFNNPTGLDVNVANGDAGAYGSAFDVARLMGAFYQAHPKILALTEEPTVSVRVPAHAGDGSRALTYPATMAPIQNLPGYIGAKTGYTDLAGGNVAAIFDLEPGHPVVAVVLHSTEQGRFDDIRTLITALRLQAGIN